MKTIFRLTLLLLFMVSGIKDIKAQYYEIANQLPGLIRPALSGSMNYKGYVEAYGLGGIGEQHATFAGISTSQGFRYSSWFFMGVGLGVDLAATNENATIDNPDISVSPDWATHSSRQTKCMIPVFTDFRFTIGSLNKTGIFASLKIGAAWLVGNGYLRMDNSRLSNGTLFYLQPTVGVRIPVNRNNSNQALNIGVTYRLLTSDNYYSWRDNTVTLNNLGGSIGFEW